MCPEGQLIKQYAEKTLTRYSATFMGGVVASFRAHPAHFYSFAFPNTYVEAIYKRLRLRKSYSGYRNTKYIYIFLKISSSL